VLVVDDNVDAAQTLQLLLEAAGHHVIVAHSAVAALEAAQASAPQLCLLDIGLPGISGYELARGLRACRHRRRHTGRRHRLRPPRRPRAGHAAGFDHYFVKPVDMDALQALIAGLPFRAP
jgi:DNA-binding response OmpR family regulator